MVDYIDGSLSSVVKIGRGEGKRKEPDPLNGFKEGDLSGEFMNTKEQLIKKLSKPQSLYCCKRYLIRSRQVSPIAL